MRTETGIPTLGSARAFPCPRCSGWAHHAPIQLVTPSAVEQVGAYEVCLDCGYSPASPDPDPDQGYRSEEWHPTTREVDVSTCPRCQHQRLRQVDVVMTKDTTRRRVGVWAVCTHCRYTPWSHT